MGLAQFRESRADAKRAAVLAAARNSFAARGFAQTSTAEIARMAGVSTATLYRHFPTKTHLFAAVLDRSTAQLAEELARGGAAGLEAMAAAYARLLCEPATRGLMRLVVAGSDPDLTQRFYETGKAATAHLFAAAVAKEVAEGRVRAEADPGQLMGMIEHPTLLLGLLAGDHRPPARPPEAIAAEALVTWRSRFGRGPESAGTRRKA